MLVQRREGFEALADHVGVRQPGFMRQDFPGGVEEGGSEAWSVERGAWSVILGRDGIVRVWSLNPCDIRLLAALLVLNPEPGRQIFLHAFLLLESIGDHDDVALWEKIMEQSG